MSGGNEHGIDRSSFNAGAESEIESRYVEIARSRIMQQIAGTLRTRPMNRPVYDPRQAGNRQSIPPWPAEQDVSQASLLPKCRITDQSDPTMELLRQTIQQGQPGLQTPKKGETNGGRHRQGTRII